MSFHKKTIRDVPLDNLTVLVRTDFDTPLNEKGELVSDVRIKSSLPTIEHLLDRGCKVVIISHFGRVGSQENISLELAATKLAQLLQRDIRFVSDIVGDRVAQSIKRSPKGSVIVLENLLFHPGEESNNADFARNLVSSTGARYFIQDANWSVNRSFATTDVITMYIPSVAGILLEQEYMRIASFVPGIDVLLDSNR